MSETTTIDAARDSTEGQSRVPTWLASGVAAYDGHAIPSNRSFVGSPAFGVDPIWSVK